MLFLLFSVHLDLDLIVLLSESRFILVFFFLLRGGIPPHFLFIYSIKFVKVVSFFWGGGGGLSLIIQSRSTGKTRNSNLVRAVVQVLGKQRLLDTVRSGKIYTCSRRFWGCCFHHLWAASCPSLLFCSDPKPFLSQHCYLKLTCT